MVDTMEGKPSGIAKAGIVTGGFYPMKSKKVYYALLKDRVLELYKTAKDEKNGKEPKLLFDLSTAFNVHIHYECTLKECLSVMLPDETFFFRPESSESDLEDWYSQLVDKARQARATLLGRPVFREEYFEVAWDVEMVKLPKLRKKSKSDEKMEDLVSKYHDRLLGKKRLCMYPHSMVIVKRGVTASENAFPPLHADEFMEFPVNAVSNFGKQEKYFFLRVGRCAPTGAGELWLSAESGDCARSIYEKISKICERESEKRRAQSSRLPSFTSRTLRSGAHRDRVHTQPHRPQADTNVLSSSFDVARKTSAVSVTSMFTSPSPSIVSPFASNARSSSFCANQSQITRSATPVAPVAWRALKEELNRSISSEGRKTSSKCLVMLLSDRDSSDAPNEDQEESSGGTIMYIGDREESEKPGNGTVNSYCLLRLTYQAPGLADQVMPKPPEGTCSAADEYTVFDSGSGANSLHDALLAAGIRPSPLVKQTPVQPAKELIAVSDGEYTQMECASESAHLPLPLPDQNFNLTEVRSYVSDSTESCHSASGDSQRAYSLGSRPAQHVAASLSATRHVHNNTSNDVADKTIAKRFDDPRKRAHSLGSKSWLKPLRKSSGIRTGSESSDGGGVRQRSDSFGSANGSGSRAASFSAQREARKGPRLSSTAHDRDCTNDLTEWDFGVSGTGRSGSSSIASIESPSQSRTSSFGVAGASLLRSAVEEVMKKQKSTDRLRTEVVADDLAREGTEGRLVDDDDNEYVLSSFGGGDEGHRGGGGGAERSPASSSQRIIGTILETNVSSSSSRSASPKSLKSLTIEDSLLMKGVFKQRCSEDDDLSTKTLLRNKVVLNDGDDYMEAPMPVTISSLHKHSSGEHPQLDYACLALSMDGSRKANANTIQSGILQVALPKFTCDYTVVDTQQP
ncbi:unnamed protein product [Toxocara canis]|uniref:Insulin receptor substrate 1 n=1 Tax=Toxocara canis TaxID=6265 RepID=A0A183UBD7_TOXCA|nr:unnamed protein product [Toxocara canis]